MRSVLLALAGLLAFAAASNENRVVCYFGSWAVYRPGNGYFDISYIDPTLCTHLIYTFVGLTEDGNVRVLDPWADLPDGGGRNGFALFNQLREQSPGTKTMVAIGGWNEGSTRYSAVVGNPTVRRRFVENVVAFVKKYGFNGFDFDWEYPNQRGGVLADKQNYVSLLKELRERFDQEGLELSAAVAAAETSASQSYLIAEVAEYLHFINLMAYDLHGTWDGKTGINAPLYAASWESGAERGLNVNASVNYWLDQGAPANKLVLGVPFYGRGFTLSDRANNGIGAPANQPSAAGPYTREAGTLGYNEICENLSKNNGWTVVFEEEQRVPYAYKDDQWIGYDDERSLKEKVDYVKSMGLGGIMVWSIETDDFRGLCGPKYPLLTTINRELRNGVIPPPHNPLTCECPPMPVPTTPKPTRPTPKPTRPIPKPTTPTPPPCGSHKPPKPVPTTPKPPTSPNPPPCWSQKPTIPVPPTNPPVTPNSVCKAEGYVRDPNDCSVFYYCQNVGGRYVASRFNCPSGLVYDESIKVCNWPSATIC